MEQLVRVRESHPDGTAVVMHVRQSACSGDCHKCSGCGAAEETILLDVRDPIGAKPGDLVRIASDTAPVLKAAAVLYLLPLILFFLGYLCGALLFHSGAAAGCLGFVLGVVLVIGYDRRLSRSSSPIYTIIGIETGK